MYTFAQDLVREAFKSCTIKPNYSEPLSEKKGLENKQKSCKSSLGFANHIYMTLNFFFDIHTLKTCNANNSERSAICKKNTSYT